MKCPKCDFEMTGPTNDFWGWSCSDCGHSQALYEHLRDYAPGMLPKREINRHIPNQDNESRHNNR
jgi:hypothetical protein